MLGAVLKKYGFCKELRDVYVNMLAGQKYKEYEIDEQVLQKLTVLRMAATIMDRVIPFDPKATFLAWINELTWSSEGRNIIHELSPTVYFPSGLNIESVKEIKIAAESMVGKATEFEDIAVGEEEAQITAYICNSAMSAQSTIKAIAIDTALTNTSSVWGVLKKKMAGGVRYTRICDYNEMLLHGLSIKRKDIEVGVNLHVAKTEHIKEKFYLFDLATIFIFEGESKSKYKDSGQLISSEYIAKLYDDKFSACMDLAIPAMKIIDRLHEYFEHKANNLKEKPKAVFRSFVEYGAFSEYQHLDMNELKYLMKLGYIERKKRGLTSYWLPSLCGYEDDK